MSISVPPAAIGSQIPLAPSEVELAAARGRDRTIWLARVGPLLLVAGSACSAPWIAVGHLTLTGDRLLGLAALVVAVGLRLTRRLHWTSVHSALAAFVAAQVVTSLLSASAWPAGPKFSTVYVLGFACFCLAAEWARVNDGTRRFEQYWIVIGALLGVLGTIAALYGNLIQRQVWGVAFVQRLSDPEHAGRFVFAAQATFNERNLFSSFLLVAFALALWRWSRALDQGRVPPWLTASLAGLVLGLVFGLTRAAWLAVAALTVLWWWTRRPPWRSLAALGSMAALAVLLQTAAIGQTPLWFRFGNPRDDADMQGRYSINSATIASWLERPVLGRGAGSINALIVVKPNGKRIEHVWNGNIVLFVLHDSGIVGLATLCGLATVVVRRARRAFRAGPSPASHLIVPLLSVGSTLAFAYVFTHALWLMYPYVYLGFLTAATAARSSTAESRLP
jgi:hypothetical protein